MQVKKSYFVKYENGTSAWLAVGIVPTGDILSTEERPMLFPDEGKVLKKKETENEYSQGLWLKDSKEEDWEEVSEAEYEAYVKAEEEKQRLEMEAEHRPE